MRWHLTVLLLTTGFACQTERPPKGELTPAIDLSCKTATDCEVIPSNCGAWAVVNRASVALARKQYDESGKDAVCEHRTDPKPEARCEKSLCVPARAGVKPPPKLFVVCNACGCCGEDREHPRCVTPDEMRKLVVEQKKSQTPERIRICASAGCSQKGGTIYRLCAAKAVKPSKDAVQPP